MGATQFRPRRGPGGQYKRRKARRLSGQIPMGRHHEQPPWYCYPISAAAFEVKINQDRFLGEQAARFARDEAKRLTDASNAHRERIAAKRAGMKFSPLSRLASETAAAQGVEL